MNTVINNNPFRTKISLDHFLCPSPAVSGEGQVHTSFLASSVSALHLLQTTTDKRRQLYKNEQKSAAQSHQTPFLEQEA